MSQGVLYFDNQRSPDPGGAGRWNVSDPLQLVSTHSLRFLSGYSHKQTRGAGWVCLFAERRIVASCWGRSCPGNDPGQIKDKNRKVRKEKGEKI